MLTILSLLLVILSVFLIVAIMIKFDTKIRNAGGRCELTILENAKIELTIN